MKIYLFSAVIGLILSANIFAEKITIHVESDGQAVVSSSVELWQAFPNKQPKLIEKGTSNKSGQLKLKYPSHSGKESLYIRSKGGSLAGKEIPNFELLVIMPLKKPETVVLNEISTIGSVWPNAQQFYISGGYQGSKNGMLIGSEHVHHLTNITKGSFGDTALNSSNLTHSETVARMNTLASLVSICGANLDSAGCSAFLNLNNSSSTLEALLKIARTPFEKPEEYFKLFNKHFPYPEGKERRNTHFLPYLSYAPEDFALKVKLSGGGIYSAGRLMFDSNANLWSGQNWMPGSQSGLNTAIGGGVSRLAPNGMPLSPALSGYNGQDIDGIGWGTTVSENKVWVGTFNGVVGVFDLEGNPLGPAKIEGKTGNFQGIATAVNGDVWICDNQLDQMVLFPGGDHTKGKIISVPGLRGPFAVAIDNKNVVWVTNTSSMTVTRFPANTPNDAIQIKVGIAPRGLGIDSKGYVWVASNLTQGFPLPEIPPGTSIIEEFKISITNIQKHQDKFPRTGNVTLISPTGDVIKENLLDGEINIGWGVTIAGDDIVYVSNFMRTGFMQVCGINTEACPQRKKTGELIHYYRSELITECTDTMIDDAGNAWVANNWNIIPALIEKNPDRRIATSGGGDGVVVIYGIARPVINPLIGQVRRL